MKGNWRNSLVLVIGLIAMLIMPMGASASGSWSVVMIDEYTNGIDWEGWSVREVCGSCDNPGDMSLNCPDGDSGLIWVEDMYDHQGLLGVYAEEDGVAGCQWSEGWLYKDHPNNVSPNDLAEGDGLMLIADVVAHPSVELFSVALAWCPGDGYFRETHFQWLFKEGKIGLWTDAGFVEIQDLGWSPVTGEEYQVGIYIEKADFDLPGDSEFFIKYVYVDNWYQAAWAGEDAMLPRFGTPCSRGPNDPFTYGYITKIEAKPRGNSGFMGVDKSSVYHWVTD